MYKKKRKKKYLFITIIIIALIMLIYIFNMNNKNYLFIEKVFHEIGNKIENIFIPKDFTIDDSVLEGLNLSLEKELNELKQINNLEKESYSFIYAKVIERDNDWYHELIINKGEKDGVKEDLTVISTQGLIGRITKTTANTSTVKLLTSNDIKVSVYINNTLEEYHGIINSYLKEEGLLEVGNIIKNSDIKKGDKVYTSGLGNIYPNGIYIGEVIEINHDNLGLSKTLKVKTNTSYDKIFYVSVVDRK